MNRSKDADLARAYDAGFDSGSWIGFKAGLRVGIIAAIFFGALVWGWTR